MHDLEITWPSGQARFTPDDSPIRVGRSPEAAIIITEPSVSRRHLEFVWAGSAWAASDYSTHGSFDPIGVRLAANWQVGTDTVVRLGGTEGVELAIKLVTTRVSGAANGEVQHAPATTPEGAAVGAASPAPLSVDAASPPAAPPQAPPSQAPPSQPQSDEAASPLVFGRHDDHRPGVPPAPDSPQPNIPVADDGLGGLGGSASSVSGQWFDASNFSPPAGEARHDGAGLFDAPSSQESAVGPLPANGVFAEVSPLNVDSRGGANGSPPSGAPDLFQEPAPHAPPTVPAGAPPGADAAGAPQFAAPSLSPPGAPGSGAGPGSGIGGPSLAPPPDAPLAANGPVPGGVTGAASATAINDSTLRLSIDGQDYVFMPGTEVTVGRDPSSLVTVDERHSLVSRRHLKFVFRGNAWWIDDFSSKGTYIDGRRIPESYEARGAFVAHLGDEDAGTPMRVITAGEHRAPKSRQNMVVYAMMAFLAVVALAVLIIALQARRDATINVDANGSNVSVRQSDVTKAKQATVLLVSSEGLGSGFFVSDTLILTNQHVAAIDDSLFVAVSRETDEPAQFEYEAETVALHPYLDIAVMRLMSDMNGNPVTGSGIEPLSVATESALTLGDPVYSTGFPNQLSLITSDDLGDISLPAVSVTGGEAANFALWPGCSNPSRDDFIPEGSPPGVTCSPEGDVAKAIVLATFSSGEGASGSPVFKDDGDEVVAVVFAGPEDEANAGRNISSDVFAGWLNETIAANQ